MALPSKVDQARRGKRFNAVIGNGATFLAPVVAWPTTTLTMALWNAEVDGKTAYFIDTVYAVVASGTPDQQGALLACVTAVAQARPTLSTGDGGGYAGVDMSSLSGKGAGSTKGVFINAITATGQTPAWFVAANAPGGSTGATIASAVLVGKLDGGVMVPPGYMLGLTVLAGAGSTPLYSLGVIWDEYEVEIE